MLKIAKLAITVAILFIAVPIVVTLDEQKSIYGYQSGCEIPAVSSSFKGLYL